MKFFVDFYRFLVYYNVQRRFHCISVGAFFFCVGATFGNNKYENALHQSAVFAEFGRGNPFYFSKGIAKVVAVVESAG